jgi:hypothetical protein
LTRRKFSRNWFKNIARCFRGIYFWKITVFPGKLSPVNLWM